MAQCAARLHPGTSLALALVSAFLFSLRPSAADALPSYSRQTGVACTQCHTIAFGPALTEYGRQFKLNGYTWGTGSSVPVSAMVVGSLDHTSKDQPEAPAEHFSRNDNLALDEASLFLAGRLLDHVGALAQVTYSGIDRNTSWDNLDVRYARPVTLGNRSLVTGVSLNNNPTVQDLWNSTPTWSFPYTSSELAPTPAAAPLITDGLGQNVLGASVYAMIDNLVYVELGGYRGLSNHWLDNLGVDSADNPNVKGVIPYWRAVLQHVSGLNYCSGGLFGLSAKLRPDTSLATTDRYTDFGVDGTYQFNDGIHHTVTVNLSYVHERQKLDGSVLLGASDSASNHLDAVRFNVDYAYEETWGASLGLFDTTGTRNAARYAPEETSGSASGSPNSRGYTLQLEYVPLGKMSSPFRPWLNARVGLQYTGYERFNGRRSNYDGFGRSASANDTLFAFAWLAF